MNSSCFVLIDRYVTSILRRVAHLPLVFVAVAPVFFYGWEAEAQPLPNGARGYVSRACGFDMDDDGIVGERDDDCRVCDGETTDPDGDGDAEDLIYVDCNSGNDSTGTGAPANPYRTIAKAFSVADGPGDGREDILCARATCSPATGSVLSKQDIPVSGVANKGPTSSWFYNRARTGPEEWDFRYPADPVMVVGWDTDKDGQYPPYDTDQPEPLIFDACSAAECDGGTKTAIGFNPRSEKDYIELAHFSMRNYGRGVSDPTGAIYFSGGATTVGAYFHDIKLEKLNVRAQDSSSRAGIYLMGAKVEYLAFENIKISEYASWPVRGGMSYSNYVRFRNIELFGLKPPSGMSVPPFKLWGLDHLEVLGLKFDPDLGNLGVSSYGSLAAVAQGPSIRGAVYRNNEFRNCHKCLHVNFRNCDAGTGSGNERTCTDDQGQKTTENLVFDRQIFTLDASLWGVEFLTLYATAADGTERGSSFHSTDPYCTGIGLRGVSVRNSVFRSTFKGLDDALLLKVGSNCATAPLDGTITVENNTFSASPDSASRLISIGRHGSDDYDYDYQYYAQSYRVRNNTFVGLDGATALLLQHRGSDGGYGKTKFPTDFIATSNSYGPQPAFVRDTTSFSSLGSWQSGTGYDSGSSSCSTSLASDGYHLSSNDTCSKDKGANAVCSSVDIDSRARLRSASDPCDRGADEEGNGGLVDPGPVPEPDPTLAAPVLREARPIPAP